VESPLTLRRYQKNAIAQLLPSSPRHDEDGDEGSRAEPITAQERSRGDVSADGSSYMLAKPTFATQLVLGCYVATQKAAGVCAEVALAEAAW
jgi:hypothetical protein